MNLAELASDLTADSATLASIIDNAGEQDGWLALTEEQRAALRSGTSDICGFIRPADLQGSYLGLLGESEVMALDPRVSGLAFKIAEVQREVHSVVEASNFDLWPPLKVAATELDTRLKGFVDLWRSKLEEAKGAHDKELKDSKRQAELAEKQREAAEAAKLAAETELARVNELDSTAGSATRSSPFNVADILSAAEVLDIQNYRTDHSKLSPEQKKIRSEIDFRDEGVNYTVEQWKHKLDTYVRVHMYFKRDGYYIGAIETFLTPRQQAYLLRRYYDKKSTSQDDRVSVMTTELFCTVVQDIVDSRSEEEILLGEAGLVKAADKYFAENKPWQDYKTEPDFFFFRMQTFLEERGFADKLDDNPQLSKNWCFMVIRHLPKHLQETVKLLAKSNKNLYKKPSEIEMVVKRWHPGFKLLNQLFGALGYNNQTELWPEVFKMMADKNKLEGVDKPAKSAGEGANTQDKDQPLLKQRANFPCVGCGADHKFTARKSYGEKYQVICPKYRDKKWTDPEVQRLRKLEMDKIAGLLKKKDKKDDESKGGKDFNISKPNADGFRKLMSAYVGTPEQKKKLLEKELDKLVDAGVSTVRVNRAATQPDVSVKLRMFGTELQATKVLLDSGAWICLFGKDFLDGLIKKSIIDGESALHDSRQTYRVLGIHNTAVNTNKYIEADTFLSESDKHGFRNDDCGVTVNGAKFFYLPQAKEVIVGRPVLNPAGLLPEQQLRRRLGKVVDAKNLSANHDSEEQNIDNDQDTDEDEHGPTKEDTFPFFKAS